MQYNTSWFRISGDIIHIWGVSEGILKLLLVEKPEISCAENVIYVCALMQAVNFDDGVVVVFFFPCLEISKHSLKYGVIQFNAMRSNGVKGNTIKSLNKSEGFKIVSKPTALKCLHV